MEVINMGIAYEVALLLCASFIRNGDPPKLDRLARSPRVALLYLSCNDAMPEALSRLNNQTYENYKLFVLDDSTDEAYKALVDSYGYETVRRGHRLNAKGGNLNHWLSLYGAQFEYFVVLDNCGILESDFIEEMLKYAEHPDNAQVAIFQSLTKAWNISRPFSRLLDAMNPLDACLNMRVLNRCDSMLCWGHNILCRTRPFQEIGGFDENFATEDFATNLRLIECGYQSKVVNVLSYDATSETAQFHAMRMTRWASGTLETAMSKSWDLPFATKLRMFMGVHCYARWFFYILGMLLVVWGYHVTWQQLYITAFFAFRWHLPHLVLYPLAIIFLYILYGVLVRPLWVTRLTRISWREYWGYSLLITAVCFYAAFYLTIGQIKSLLGKKARFIIYEKRWFRSSLWDIVTGMRWTVLLSLVVAIGFIRNPVGWVIHFVWYIPLFLSPLIIYWAQNTPAGNDTN
jgi:cellulose synthase/poly-beta-1,6-N-acetylglucosamine synthase-like glycosyltransferase